jgi:hypothetical protein
MTFLLPVFVVALISSTIKPSFNTVSMLLYYGGTYLLVLVPITDIFRTVSVVVSTFALSFVLNPFSFL